MANYWSLKKRNFEIWEDTAFALGKAATAKQGRGKTNKQTNQPQPTDMQQDKALVLAWASNTHPAPHGPQSRHRGQGVRSVQRPKCLIKRDLESKGWRKKMSALVPAALIEGFSSLIRLTASTIRANYAVPAPAHYILTANLG